MMQQNLMKVLKLEELNYQLRDYSTHEPDGCKDADLAVGHGTGLF